MARKAQVQLTTSLHTVEADKAHQPKPELRSATRLWGISGVFYQQYGHATSHTGRESQAHTPDSPPLGGGSLLRPAQGRESLGSHEGSCRRRGWGFNESKP